jgi:hypothetical protein
VLKNVSSSLRSRRRSNVWLTLTEREAIVKQPALYGFSALLLFPLWAIVTVSPDSDAQ